jgi:hypothetical protein
VHFLTPRLAFRFNEQLGGERLNVLTAVFKIKVTFQARKASFCASLVPMNAPFDNKTPQLFGMMERTEKPHIDGPLYVPI